jgi:EpsD family peptidyl-prolyl cis-trans isomerase
MFHARIPTLIAVSALALALAACGGDKEGSAKKNTQVAAKVNGEEITVHQVNAALPRMNNPTDAQARAAAKQVLDRLVDQQLFIQKAAEAKLDRDPAVMTAIENAKREILARAYVERVMGAAAKANPESVREFYGKHPELFSQRRVYRLQEIALQAKGEQADAVRKALPDMKTLQDVVAYAKANNVPFQANNQVRAAEQLPMEFAAKLAAMKDGEIVAIPGPNGFAVVQIAQSQSQPLDEKQATPFIEQYLQNRSKMDLAQTELKTLRSAAKIEYVGEFAKAAAEAPAAAPVADKTPEQTAKPEGDVDVAKGLSGLKK